MQHILPDSFYRRTSVLGNHRIVWSATQIPFQAEIKLACSQLENFANTD